MLSLGFVLRVYRWVDIGTGAGHRSTCRTYADLLVTLLSRSSTHASVEVMICPNTAVPEASSPRREPIGCQATFVVPSKMDQRMDQRIFR